MEMMKTIPNPALVLEAFKVEKEKEAESLRKMKEEKLDLAYSEYCKKLFLTKISLYRS